MNEIETDTALVQQMQQGDLQAFDTLYARYKNEAFRTAYLITGNQSDAEDLTQEAFVTCIQSINTLKDGSRFRPWLLKTLTRSAWKYCKKQKRETPVAEFFEAGEQGESALSALLHTDEQKQLQHALYMLDEKRRTVIVLYYFNEMSVKEIAKTLGVLEGTVKSRLFSARRHLRQALTARVDKPKEAHVS